MINPSPGGQLAERNTEADREVKPIYVPSSTHPNAYEIVLARPGGHLAGPGGQHAGHNLQAVRQDITIEGIMKTILPDSDIKTHDIFILMRPGGQPAGHDSEEADRQVLSLKELALLTAIHAYNPIMKYEDITTYYCTETAEPYLSTHLGLASAGARLAGQEATLYATAFENFEPTDINPHYTTLFECPITQIENFYRVTDNLNYLRLAFHMVGLAAGLQVLAHGLQNEGDICDRVDAQSRMLIKGFRANAQSEEGLPARPGNC